MKVTGLVIIAGCIMLVFGIIFHFQGYGDIGPESSFMYRNPDWIDYGKTISVIGAVVIGMGVILKIKS